MKFFIQNVRQWLWYKFSFSEMRFFGQFVQKVRMSAPDSFAKVVAWGERRNFHVAFNGRRFHFNWNFCDFHKYGSDYQRRKILYSEQNCSGACVWGCMNFLSTKSQRFLVDLEVLAAAEIVCLRRINIVSDFYVHQEREKTKWSQKSIKIS